jgi:hypothetical protein
MRFMAFMLASTVAASAAVVAQQNQFEQQVRQQLGKIGENLGAKGYELTYQVYTGALKEAATESVTFRLRRGIRYAIVGVCDQDCGDLDSRLFDPAGREIGRDAEKDDTPVIELVADKTGEYELRVEMAECADEPCAFGVGVFAAGEDEFEKQVRQQIEKAGGELARQGFSLTHQIFTGDLKDAETENVIFELDATGTYVVLGVCDNDCKDLDLELLDPAGRQVDSDVEEDDAPVVAVSPARRERYTVRAIMADCTASPCRYGIGVFKK